MINYNIYYDALIWNYIIKREILKTDRGRVVGVDAAVCLSLSFTGILQ